jgi:acetyl-CoA acetyltransferase family protein
MKEVVIGGYLRTAQTRARPGDPSRDWFYQLRADDLLARLIPELLNRHGVDSGELDDFLVGSALGVSEQWTFGGRTPVLLADLDARVPARFIDQQCGSGMAAVQLGYAQIAAGCADIVLACGMEHMTRVPIGPSLFNSGAMSINPALYSDERYRRWDMATTMNMGLTAEKLATHSGIERGAMDDWAVLSHRRAAAAQADGFTAGEILPICAEQADGTMLEVDRDQAVRPDIDPAGMAQLKPAFRADGVITAGNSSPLSSGAAAMLLLSREQAERRGSKARFAVRSFGMAGVDPTLMGIGPVPATTMALKRAGLSANAIDFWEINEAFSVVVLHCIRQLGIDPERVNIHGGALALGHPLGATGIRLAGTLARVLDEQGGRYGCATACVGGGQGVSLIIERIV